MRPQSVILSTPIIMSLTGCAAVTPSMLRESATAKGHVMSITVNENYQSVYRRLAEKIRAELFPPCIIISGYRIDAELYTDLGFGEISSTEIALSEAVLSVDIRAKKDSTEVTVFWERWENSG